MSDGLEKLFYDASYTDAAGEVFTKHSDFNWDFPPEEDEETRLQRKKELSRTSQKRYRERIKEKETSFEQEVQEMQAQLDQALSERRSLEIEVGLLREQYEQIKDPEWFIPASQAFGKEHVQLGAPKFLLTMSRVQELSRQEVAQMTPEHLQAIWQDLSNAIDKHQPHDTAIDVNSTQARLLKAAVLERHGILAYASAHNPGLPHRMKYIPKDANYSTHEIARSVQLSPEQWKYVVEHRSAFREAVQQFHAVFMPIYNKILKCDTESEQWAELVDALKGVVFKEHVQAGRFYALLWRPNGLHFLQEARLCAITRCANSELADIVDLLEAPETPNHSQSGVDKLVEQCYQYPLDPQPGSLYDEMASMTEKMNVIRMHDDKPLPVYKRSFT